MEQLVIVNIKQMTSMMGISFRNLILLSDNNALLEQLALSCRSFCPPPSSLAPAVKRDSVLLADTISAISMLRR